MVAVLVGGIEALGLLAHRLHLVGGLWNVVATLNGDFGSFGYLIVAVFVVSWVISAAIYRLKGYDALDVVRAAD